MWRSLVLLALLASAQGRAVNISNTWVLPEEGFPVFYRYFRDRISWYEADAVCQFHHANLVTVDTTAQYDAVRAYLKELDISSAVWVGLIRSNPDGDFTWTDYRGLSSDGYWSSAPDTRSAPLCAAADPAADYRWEARACGGPTVASFICELPVPQWALGNEGCMVRELPALTILYLPESAAVQLNADCGLAGVKRVQCTGNVRREGLLKDLTCADEEEISSTSIGTNWPPTTDNTADPDIASAATTEENTTTEHEVDINQPIVRTATLLPQYIMSKSQYKSPTTFTDMDNLNTVTFSKDVNLEGNDDNNIQSNFIPQLDDDHVLASEQLQKLEDERHMQHKMLHEEIARVGNVDNIFTQPTDHFIPPLVMAKSRMSDDMTVLSLAEKHAQQVAEKQFGKHQSDDESNKLLSDDTLINKPLITSVKPNKIKESKQNNLKSHVPKKYVNEKYYDSKEKFTKMWQSKTTEINLVTDTTPIPTIAGEDSKRMSSKGHSNNQDKIDKDFAMDLTVMLKDTPFTSEERPSPLNYESDVAKLETITKQELSTTNESETSETYQESVSYNPIGVDQTYFPTKQEKDEEHEEHEVIQITVISNDDPAVNTSVFEITTKMPIFRDDTEKDKEKANVHSASLPAMDPKETENTETITTSKPNQEITFKPNQEASPSESTIVSASFSTVTVTEKPLIVNFTTEHIYTTTEILTTEAEVFTVSASIMPLLANKTEVPEMTTTMNTTPFFNVSDEVTVDYIDKIAIGNLSAESHNNLTLDESHVTLEKLDFNNTGVHDLLEKNTTDTEEIVDDNSPLLSGIYEPVHRPPRTRRPQQQNRKFNPFRILG